MVCQLIGTDFVKLTIRESGDSSRARDFLPADKQYLITRNGELLVSCTHPELMSSTLPETSYRYQLHRRGRGCGEAHEFPRRGQLLWLRRHNELTIG